MTSRAYLDAVGRKLGPALVAYTSDPGGRETLARALDSWGLACSETGVADGPDGRALVVQTLLAFVAQDDGGRVADADELRDRAATLVLALLDGTDGTPGGGVGRSAS